MRALTFRVLPLLLLGSMCAATDEPTVAPTAVVMREPKPVTRDELATALRTPPGRVRFITFWATWCGPCMAELPHIRAFAARHPDVEVTLVNVDVPAMHTTRVLPAIHGQRLEGITHLLLQSTNPAGDLVAVVPGWAQEIPFTLVQRPDGVISASRAVPLAEPELEGLLAAARP